MPKQVKLTPNKIGDILTKSGLIKPFEFGDIIIHPILTPLLHCILFARN